MPKRRRSRYDSIEKIHVTADDEWAGLDILAVFHAPDGTATKVVVGADGMLAVPPEATAKQAGVGRIVFVGLAENVQRITLDMGYNIKPHTDIDGDNPGTPTPDVVQQILANSNNAVSIATAAQDAAENARQAAEDAAKKAGEGAGGAAASAAAAKKSAEDAAASSDSAAGKAEESASLPVRLLRMPKQLRPHRAAPKMLLRQPLMQRVSLDKLLARPAVPLRLPAPVLTRPHRVQRRLKLPRRKQKRKKKKNRKKRHPIP